jgi:hormone-sensitive lipase
MNIKPKKVIIAGDSAGGNLACSVTGLTLKLDLQIPDGLLLVYPAVDTRNQFSPSRINSFNDVILYPTLLMLCMQEYLGEDAS